MPARISSMPARNSLRSSYPGNRATTTLRTKGYSRASSSRHRAATVRRTLTQPGLYRNEQRVSKKTRVS